MEKRKQRDTVDEETAERVKKKVKTNVDDDADDTGGDPSSERDVHSSSKASSLEDLLDFSSLSDQEAISSRFDELARVLIHEYHFVVCRAGVETAFEIQEMEFYLQKAICHEDPFTHGSEEQKVSGRWYFHRAPRRSNDASRSSTSLTSYRGGTRKGLDLTIGNTVPRNISSHFGQSGQPGMKSSVAHKKAERGNQGQSEDGELLRGGILLRSLRSTSKGFATPQSKSVSGPSLLVDKVLELSKAPGIPELVENLWGGDTTALNPPESSSSSRSSYLYLKRVAAPASTLPKIHKSPRIGLDLSHPGTTIPTSQTTLAELHSRIRFLPKTYRYFTRPKELTKGRSQTLYGLIRATLDSLPDRDDHRSLSGDKAFRNTVVTTTGIKDALVEKYLAEYDAGRKDGLRHLKLCIGPNGKGAADSPTTYLKLMGALDGVFAALPHV